MLTFNYFPSKLKYILVELFSMVGRLSVLIPHNYASLQILFLLLYGN